MITTFKISVGILACVGAAACGRVPVEEQHPGSIVPVGDSEEASSGPVAITGQPANGMRSWRAGDSWRVDVDYYSEDWMFQEVGWAAEKAEPSVQHRYQLGITVVGTNTVAVSNCWMLDFMPLNAEVPLGVRGHRFRVWVSMDDGSIRKIKEMAGGNVWNPLVGVVKDIHVLFHVPRGFPIELIPWNIAAVPVGTVPTSGRVSAWTTKAETVVNGSTQTVVTLAMGTPNNIRIEQTWTAGANWWSEYRRYIGGHINLPARLREGATP